MDIENDLNLAVVHKFNEAYKNAHPALLAGKDYHKKLLFSAPEYAIKRMVAYFSNDRNLENSVIYMSILVIPSAENCISLFHKDYPLFQDEKMISRVKL